MILWRINSCTKCKFLSDFYDRRAIFLLYHPVSS